MKKLAWILHGRHTRSSLQKQISDSLTSYEHRFYITTERGEAIDRTQQAIQEGAECLIAVGGDGTLNEVCNGYMRAAYSKENLCMTVLPRGSGNDVARYFKISSSLQHLSERLKNMQTRSIDVLHIQSFNDDGSAYDRYCLNVADVGLGGKVTQLVNQKPRSFPADAKYFISVIQSFFVYEKCGMTLRMDTEEWQGQAMSICMANFVYFGSGMGVAPHAIPDDGLAAITIIGDVSVWDYLRLTPALRKAQFLRHPQISYHQTTSCRIETERRCAIEIDGEYAGVTPLNMKVIPKAIRFVV